MARQTVDANAGRLALIDEDRDKAIAGVQAPFLIIKITVLTCRWDIGENEIILKLG